MIPNIDAIVALCEKMKTLRTEITDDNVVKLRIWYDNLIVNPYRR